MTTPSPCPSEFALERWRFGELAASPDEPRIVAHLAGCKACRARHAELATSEQPALDTDPIWSEAVAARPIDRGTRGLLGKPWQALASNRWRGRLWQATGLATAALSVCLLVSGRRSLPDTITKGAWQLAVIAKGHDGRVIRLDPGAAVVPGDRLRFEVATSWPKADLALVILDSAGKVSRLAPSTDRPLSIVGGKRVLLDEAVELDGALGPERIVLVGCNHTLDVSQVVASAARALAAAGGDPRQVRSLGTDCHEESFWLSKVSP